MLSVCGIPGVIVLLLDSPRVSKKLAHENTEEKVACEYGASRLFNSEHPDFTRMFVILIGKLCLLRCPG